MATQNKNFKVKNGLDVSGTATADAFALTVGGILEALPSKDGQSGKFLSTDGTALTWASVGASSIDGGDPGSTYNGSTLDGGSP